MDEVPQLETEGVGGGVCSRRLKVNGVVGFGSGRDGLVQVGHNHGLFADAVRVHVIVGVVRFCVVGILLAQGRSCSEERRVPHEVYFRFLGQRRVGRVLLGKGVAVQFGIPSVVENGTPFRVVGEACVVPGFVVEVVAVVKAAPIGICVQFQRVAVCRSVEQVRLVEERWNIARRGVAGEGVRVKHGRLQNRHGVERESSNVCVLYSPVSTERSRRVGIVRFRREVVPVRQADPFVTRGGVICPKRVVAAQRAVNVGVRRVRSGSQIVEGVPGEVAGRRAVGTILSASHELGVRYQVHQRVIRRCREAFVRCRFPRVVLQILRFVQDAREGFCDLRCRVVTRRQRDLLPRHDGLVATVLVAEHSSEFDA